MKKCILSAIALISFTFVGFSQVDCDSIHLSSGTIPMNQTTDTDARVYFTYNSLVNPFVVYPYFGITLSDTTDLVFREVFYHTFLGQMDSVDLEITYKTPNLPNGYSVAGTFDVYDPNTNPNLLCQHPIVIVITGNTLSVSETDAFVQFSVFPNPATDLLSVRANQFVNQATAHIFDAAGKELLSQKLEGETDHIQVSALSSGMYLLLVEDGESRFHTTFVKE